MYIAFNVFLLIIGFAALTKGAELFVDGSAGIARRFGVPSLVIGLTIVALGTSAPELAVSVSAAAQGSNELALSNVTGSNLFNLLVVMGLCALISPVRTDTSIMKRDLPLSIALTAAVLAPIAVSVIKSGVFSGAGLNMTARAGEVTRLGGALLVGSFFIYIIYLILGARNKKAESAAGAEPQKDKALWLLVLLSAAGLALIIGGGQAVVRSAQVIARAAGMSETLIGLTIVAVGTSLPELVTSLVAAKKKETGLALGNIVGSNLINIMLILGLSALISPVGVNLASLIDLGILLVVSVIALAFLTSARTLRRWEGAMLVCIYAAHTVFAIIR